VTGRRDEPPIERAARWTDVDAAIVTDADAAQLRAQVAERVAEIDDLKARLGQLIGRVAQLEADNAELRRAANRVSPGELARRVYRRARMPR
jgi:hypothetical protein